MLNKGTCRIFRTRKTCLILRPSQWKHFVGEMSLPSVGQVSNFGTPSVFPHLQTSALPRYLDTDDEYKGYRLPAGSIVIANSWCVIILCGPSESNFMTVRSMLHDEEVYPDPFTFNPDRFMKDGVLDKSARDPSHACWGFGRR